MIAQKKLTNKTVVVILYESASLSVHFFFFPKNNVFMKKKNVRMHVACNIIPTILFVNLFVLPSLLQFQLLFVLVNSYHFLVLVPRILLPRGVIY